MRAFLGCALAVLCPAVAAADSVTSAHTVNFELGPATIDVEMRERVARTTIRYEVRNPDPLPDEATIELALPAGAAVVGMRHQPRPGGRWLEARLLAADDAGDRWERFEEAPYVANRGPALLELRNGIPILRLLFVPARSKVTVEYTLLAPVCRAGGHWFAPAPNVDPAGFSVRGPRGGGRVLSLTAASKLAGVSLEAACERTAPAFGWSDEPVMVAVAAPVVTGVASRMVMVPVGEKRLIEVWVDTAAQLAPLPREASVVFVVDASHSMGAAGVASQLAMVSAYLARAPGARFEIVVYRRFAHRLFGRWRDGDAAAGALAGFGGGGFALGNGSNLDAGLALAAELLAHAPEPRRLVAFTDDRMRDSLDGDAAMAALAKLPVDAIAHVVVTAGEEHARSSLVRDLDHWLAPVMGRWGGIAARGAVGVGGESRRARGRVFEELVRPHKIEAVVIRRGDGSRDEIGEIVEGESVRWFDLDDDDAVTVSGFIWGRPWQPTLVSTESAQRQVVALAFGEEDLLAGLSEPVERQLASFAHVVSAATSLWADDPRWTPGGLPPEATESGTSGLCGLKGRISGLGSVVAIPTIGRTGVAPRRRPDLDALLAVPIATCASRAGVSSWNVSMEIETTGREVVDVLLLEDGDVDGGGGFASCVFEAAWALELGADFQSWTARFDVRVVGATAQK